MANDIRDILKGLDAVDKAIYTETRSNMRRAYLYAHSKTLDISKYNEEDDAFLDLIDIRIAQLFDRAGKFDSGEKGGHLDTDRGKEIADSVSDGSKMLAAWPKRN